MLCTPPAFILSQDQTLEIIVSKHRSSGSVIQSLCFRVLLLAFFYFCLSSILVRIVRDPFAHTFICFVLLSCCSIFKDHSPPLSRRPLKYTTSSPVCQYLFKTFFKFFQGFFRDRCGAAETQLVYYTTLIRICQHFF